MLLGKHVACDAYDETKPFRVVTHAHADHMMGLQQSLEKCEKVLMTEATRDLVAVMRDQPLYRDSSIETLDYGKPVQLEEETITFLPADHILGAAQVLINDGEGTRIVFTGDFKIENTPILEADILVMEATYGSPHCRRTFKNDVKRSLVSLVEQGLKQGAVYVFGYHGKLQEVMQVLRDAGIAVPFVAPDRVRKISKVCEKHGMRIGTVLSDELGGTELLEGNCSCVAFYHMNSRRRIGHDAFRITVSGWEFCQPQRQTGPREYTVALSDHSDYVELIDYVKRAGPKSVITDGYRDGHAETFAGHIRKHLGIPAIALPKN